LWGSPQLQEGFAQIGAGNEDPFPSLHSMFADLTHAMDHMHVDWFLVGADELGPNFEFVRRSAEEWDAILSAMAQDIVNGQAHRLLEHE
jgi:hypothetical protein